MAQTIDDICQLLQSYVLTLPGVRDAKDYPIENPLSGLVSMCYSGGGESWLEAEQKKGMHKIILELSVPRKDLPRDYAALSPFIDSVPVLLLTKFDPSKSGDGKKWGGLAEAIGKIESGQPAVEDYSPPSSGGSVLRLVLRFTIRDVKTYVSLV